MADPGHHPPERELPRLVLVVDAANVVGSVPGGWWKDRAGAATRLHRQLLKNHLGFDEVVLVLEGRALSGVPAGSQDGVTTVHATGAGDDEIVAQCEAAAAAGATLTLASADRRLLARLTHLGMSTLGPRSLRELLALTAPAGDLSR